ncbi:MAG: hypothetical protein J1E40_12585 [Oscillospiraceae bacterium]|nr:hypothetical protein [Oscillospiraceae bacterium]
MEVPNSFDEILDRYEPIKEYAVRNFSEFKNRADNAEVIKYGTDCNDIGCLNPKFERAICKARYGRYLKNKPEDGIEYTIYAFSQDMHPLRVRKSIADGKYGFSCATYYFFDYNGITYACPFHGDTDEPYIGGEIYVFIYHNERLTEFGFFDRSRVHLKIADYDKYPRVYLTVHDFLRDKRHYSRNEYQYHKWLYEYEETLRGKIIDLKMTGSDTLYKRWPEFEGT